MATEREYRITISAMLGRGVAPVMADFVAEATRAKAKVDSIFSQPNKGAKKAAEAEGKVRVDEAKKAQAELDRIREKENDKILRDVARHEKAQERAQAKIAKIKERYFAEEQRRGERADAEKEKRNQKIASDAMGYMRKAAGVASRVAGELTSGFGVNFDVSSSMQRGASVDDAARRTTLSGFGAKGQNATEADVQSTIATIKKAGDETKQSYGALAQGLEDFVSKSSDLDTGKKVLGDLGRIARATGTDVNELVSAAGDVNKTLEDGPDKAERLLEVMTLVATQSAKGAVEVKDFAKYMGRITAGAFKFEGSRAQNIGILSGLAQVAMSGGASGPREATNAAQAFSNDLTKGKALDRFQSAGINVFTDESKTKLRSPEKIITDYLRKSGGNLADLSKFFQNEGSRRVITGFAQKFSEAGGGEAGIKAVEAEFKKFAESMSTQDIQKRSDLSGEGRAAKAVEFQNKLDTIVDSMAMRVLPAFEKLAPDALKVADALAGIVTAAVDHPWAAVGLAITGSIAASVAKAAIGEQIGKILASGTGSLNFGLGVLAMAAIAAAAAISDYTDKADKAEGDTKKDVEQTIPQLVAKAQKQLKETGTIDRDTLDTIAQKRAELEGIRVAGKQTDLGTDKMSYSAILAAKMTGGADQIAGAEGSLAYGAENKDKVDKTAAAIDALLQAYKESKPKKGEVQHVHIDNLPAAGVAAPTAGTVPQ